MTNIKKVLGAAVGIGLILFTACGDSGEIRKYQEPNKETVQSKTSSKKMRSPHGSGMMSPRKPKQVLYTWDLPEGWTEKPTSSNIRLATFIPKSTGEKGICTIIQLSGSAGGREANVKRWLSQIGQNFDDTSPDLKKVLQSSLKFKTAGGFDAELFDLTQVTPKKEAVSILVTIIDLPQSKIFIKFSGESGKISLEKDKFTTLSKSFRKKDTK